MFDAVQSSKPIKSNTSESQEVFNEGLKSLFESMGFEVETFQDAEQRAAKDQPKKPSWCDCDPIVNGKTGRICQTHLFEAYRKKIGEKK